MNLLEFKRRLMTDPACRDPEMADARARFPEAARAAEDFENRLQGALHVPPPADLAARLQAIPDTADDPPAAPRRWLWPASMAATLALGMLMGAILFSGPGRPDLQEYLAHHWLDDGPQAIAAMQASVPEPALEAVTQVLDFHLVGGIREQVRFVKLCPAPDGVGAHLVLATEQGPVTVYYLPGLKTGDRQPLRINGMQAWVADLETGAVTVIAPPETDGETILEDFRRDFRAGLTL